MPTPWLARAATYALAGFVCEVLFSAAHDATRGREIRMRTSPWMLPIYALIAPLYEPMHGILRTRAPWLVRGGIYGAGFLAVEYASGSLWRHFRGEAPWDYTYARFHVHGLIRPDYFFLWAAAGLALEPLHDVLVRDGRE